MRPLLTIAKKDLLLLWRDKLGLFWIVAFPLIMALFFGAIFGGDGPRGQMTVIVVDQDDTDGSRDFIDALENSDALNVRTQRGDPPTPWTRDAARDVVARGNATAYVLIPEGYGDAPPMFYNAGPDNDAPTLEVGIDPARSAERGLLQGLLTEASFRRMQDFFTDREKMRDMLSDAIVGIDEDEDIPFAQRIILKGFLRSVDAFYDQFDEELLAQGPGGEAASGVAIEVEDVQNESASPANAFEITFPQGMSWGFIGAAAGFAISLVRERKAGTLQRLQAAPLSRGHVLAGKGLACFLTIIAVIAVVTLLGVAVFGIRVQNAPLFAISSVCTAACFVGVMMMVSTLGRTEEAVAGSGWGVMIVFAMLGGSMIPQFVMPAWMASVRVVSPVYWAIYALEGSIWRGLGVADLALAWGVLVGIGAATFGVGVWIFTKRD